MLPLYALAFVFCIKRVSQSVSQTVPLMTRLFVLKKFPCGFVYNSPSCGHLVVAQLYCVVVSTAIMKGMWGLRNEKSFNLSISGDAGIALLLISRFDTMLIPLELCCDWICCEFLLRRAIMRRTPFWNSPYVAAYMNGLTQLLANTGMTLKW